MSESSIGGEQNGVECLGKGHIHGVPPPNRVAKLPCSGKQEAMSEPLRRPRLQALDGLARLGAVQAPAEVLAAQNGEHLHIHDVCGAA